MSRISPDAQGHVDRTLMRGFDLCLDLVCLAGFDGYFRFVNRSWETELGYSSDELLSRPYLDFVHPDDRDSTTQEADGLAGGHPTWTFENRYRRKDGSYVWLSWRATPLPESESILAVARNVTERRQRELETASRAEEAQRTLDRLVDNLPGVVYRCRDDAAYSVEFISRSCTALTGYDPEDLIANRISPAQLIHPDDLPDVRTVVAANLRMRRPFSLTCRIRTSSGEEKWIWAQGRGVYGETGELLKFEGYAADVTDEKSAAEQLRQQALLLDGANDAISVRDLDQVVTYWNKGAERLWGWPANEAVGRPMSELVTLNDDEFRHALRSTLNDGYWTGELHETTREGRHLVVEARWTLIRDTKGRPQSILSITDDRTETRQLQSHLLRTQRLDSIGTLASGIAHDLNNTLSPILMGVQMLRQHYGARDGETIDIIERCALQGSKLVKQVLTFGRGVEGDRVAVQLRHIVREVCEVLENNLPAGVSLKQRCPRDLWPISADPVQLEQVVMNLLLNARDALPEGGGSVTITGQNVLLDETYARMHAEARPGRYVVVEVCDTGCGIPAEVQERLFEPFFTTKRLGTGLGLSTVYSIVKSHLGFVSVYSEIDRGSTFRVLLPASLANGVPDGDLPRQAPKGQGELVLVVDDEAPVREMASVVLASSGYRAEVASNGAEAVARYARGGIDAVILDWSMPVMNGGVTIVALRGLDPEARIVVSSGLSQRSELTTVEPPVPFLAKPYTTEELLHRLAGVFGRGNPDSSEPER